MVDVLVKKVWKWIREHVRPYSQYKAKKGEEIDMKKDSAGEIIDKAKKQTEVGIKFTFKF